MAGSVKVGNALGAGNTELAKLSAKISITCAGTTVYSKMIVKVFIQISLDMCHISNIQQQSCPKILYKVNMLYIWIIKLDFQLLATFLTISLLYFKGV